MQQEILLWCLAAPALAALVAAASAILVGRFERRSASAGASETKASWRPAAQAVISVVLWCAGLATALAGRQTWEWWPEDAWRQVLWPITAASIAIALCIGERGRDLRWLLAALGAMATAMLVMPAGERWTELFALHRAWGFAIAGAALLNMWMLDALARRRGERWVLWVALAGLGGPMILAGATYAGLAEWVLSAIAATFIFAVASSLVPSAQLWSVLYPASLFAAAAVASSRFYTYEEHPAWLYAAALLTPTAIALVDLPLRNRGTAIRVIVAIVIAAAILGAMAWKLKP